MAETLGMLCDKLTIVKLKEYHTDDPKRLDSLKSQSLQLQNEIDQYVQNALNGEIPVDALVFAANKVFKKENIQVPVINGGIGEVFYQLADVNCELWHQQEKVYDFDTVPPDEKNAVVKQLAILNLQRNDCIDSINQQFANLITEKGLNK